MVHSGYQTLVMELTPQSFVFVSGAIWGPRQCVCENCTVVLGTCLELLGPHFFRLICVCVCDVDTKVFSKRDISYSPHITPPGFKPKSPHFLRLIFVCVCDVHTKVPIFFSLNTNSFQKEIFHIVPTFFSSDLCMCM